jgi:hypothetical protein
MGGTDFFDEDVVSRRGTVKSSTLGGTEVVGTLKPDEMPARPISDLNLTRMARHREEVNTQVASAKLEIERMRRKQSDLEREKQTLEELLEKQDQYERGKQEMIDRLTQSVVSLQKLEEHAARQVEIYAGTRRRFGECGDELQRINDSEWPDETFRDELNKAVTQIDAIRKEFVKAQAAVEAVGGPLKLFDESRASLRGFEEEEPGQRGFVGWLKIGLAFSLPLIVAIAVAVAIMVATGR